jgi:hypothetical protein
MASNKRERPVDVRIAIAEQNVPRLREFQRRSSQSSKRKRNNNKRRAACLKMRAQKQAMDDYFDERAKLREEHEARELFMLTNQHVVAFDPENPVEFVASRNKSRTIRRRRNGKKNK